MKLTVYDIINNPTPTLHSLKEFNVNKKDFEYEDTIVKVLNDNLLFDKLSSEHMYALGLTYGLEPKGIIQVSVGTDCECVFNKKILATGLILIGAENYMLFHNHTGGNKEISISDKKITKKAKELGDIIGIELIKHIMVTQNYYAECKSIDLEEGCYNTLFT